MPTTSPDDVAARLGRPLEPGEDLTISVLIVDAERMIASRTRDRSLVALDADSVKQVAANAVVRVLRNPDGYRSESAGDVSYTIDTRVAAGFLTILADEWSLLGIGTGSAGSFAPRLEVPAPGAYGIGGPWWP